MIISENMEYRVDEEDLKFFDHTMSILERLGRDTSMRKDTLSDNLILTTL
jgi:hypothetical protein